jgi:predicted alpha/beta-hydrolase family hydrolase
LARQTNAEVALFTNDLMPPVRGFLHRPAGPSQNTLVLTHGAGSNCEAPLLVALADIFAGAGFTVLRCDLPYRQKRPHGPPFRGDAALDREGLRNAVTALKGSAAQGSWVFLGGHSYGGRQATLLAAEDPSIADGLLLLSYPLHPPRQPSQLRTGHFPSLRTPALFVHGTNDPFGSLEEIRAALDLIPARTSLLPFEGAGHDLLPARKAAPTREAVTGPAQRVLEAFLTFFGNAQANRVEGGGPR